MNSDSSSDEWRIESFEIFLSVIKDLLQNPKTQYVKHKACPRMNNSMAVTIESTPHRTIAMGILNLWGGKDAHGRGSAQIEGAAGRAAARDHQREIIGQKKMLRIAHISWQYAHNARIKAVCSRRRRCFECD